MALLRRFHLFFLCALSPLAQAGAELDPQDLRSLKFVRMESDSSKSFVVGRSSQKLRDKVAGMREIAAFELPFASQPYELVVQSIAMDTQTRQVTIMLPCATLYDETFEAIRQLCADPDVLRADTTPYFELRTLVSTESRRARYLIVHAMDEGSLSRTLSSGSNHLFESAIAERMPDRFRRLVSSRNGSLQIYLKTFKPRHLTEQGAGVQPASGSTLQNR